MAVFKRLLFCTIAPAVALVAIHDYIPDSFRTLEEALHRYVDRSPISQYLANQLPPRSEIPLLVSSETHQSHFEKMAVVATALAELGHPVTFMCGNVFADAVAKLHPDIKFYPFQGQEDKLTAEEYAYWMSLPSGVESEIWITKKVLVDKAPDVYNTYQTYFEEFRKTYGDEKPLISIYDFAIAGHQTFLLGVPGIKPDASIGVSGMPRLLHSNDTFPPRLGKKPHQGPDARVVHQKAYDGHADQYEWEVSKAWWAKLKEMGSTYDEFPQILDGMERNPDYVMNTGIPEFDFPRTEVNPKLRYFGILQNKRQKSDRDPDLPSWWNDLIKAKEEGKKVIAVTQGTVETKPEELIIPTLEALEGRDDVLIIATFYQFDPEEVEGLVVPSNTRVAKYIPHDKLLPFVDLMIGNGGYGAVNKCINSGIPQVISGVSQDKALVGALVDYTGVGINLAERNPSSEKIREAVTRIFEDPSYRAKAQEFSKVYARYDMQKEFDKLVQEVVRDWQKRQKSFKEEL